MRRVTSVQPLDGYRLNVTFDDGMNGVVSLEDRLFGSMFEPLRDTSLFNEAFVDEFGVICWPNGADLAPDALHHQISTAASVTA